MEWLDDPPLVPKTMAYPERKIELRREFRSRLYCSPAPNNNHYRAYIHLDAVFLRMELTEVSGLRFTVYGTPELGQREMDQYNYVSRIPTGLRWDRQTLARPHALNSDSLDKTSYPAGFSIRFHSNRPVKD